MHFNMHNTSYANSNLSTRVHKVDELHKVRFTHLHRSYEIMIYCENRLKLLDINMLNIFILPL